MPAIQGRLGSVKVSDDAFVSSNTVGGITSATLNRNIDELDTTSFDSAGTRSFLPNHDDSTLDIDALWLAGDPGQDIIRVAVSAKTLFDFRFAPTFTTGLYMASGKAFATSWSPSNDLEDAAKLSQTLRLSAVVDGVVP